MLTETFRNLRAPSQMQAAGGKGRALAQLLQAGFPVPDGFIIFDEAFDSQGRIDPEAWLEAERHLAVLREVSGAGARFAVRSSALSEDSTTTSFAGEFETVLDLRSDAELREATATVYRSRQSERAAAYAQAHGVLQEQQMAVVVQLMIPAQMAGVLFTADPVSGSHNHLIGNFVRGLGESLVSGEANAQSFSLERIKGTYQGPSELKPYRRNLHKQAMRIEKELEGPQDIEWAIAGGELNILQSRPITTMNHHDPATGAWNDSLRGDYLWTNANFGEAVPDVMTPMTWSLVQIYGQEAFSFPIPGGHPLFGNVGGRFYINVSALASMMRSVGLSHRRIQKEAEGFFGRIPDDIAMPIISFSPWSLVPRFVRYGMRMRRRIKQNRAELGSFTSTVAQRCEQFRDEISAVNDLEQLRPVWTELLAFYRQACQMLQAGTSKYEGPAQKLRAELTKKVGQEDAIALLSGCSGDEEQLASLGPLLGLWKMGRGELTQAEFVQRYGHRGPHEFELSTPRPAEDPGWIDKRMQELQDVDVGTMLSKQASERDEVWQRFCRNFPRKQKGMQRRLDDTAAAARGREAIRSEIVRIIGVVRALAVRAGELTGLSDGVFFLSIEELEQRLVEDDTAVGYIAARRSTYERLSKYPAYPALINGRFDPDRWAKDPKRRYDRFDAHEASAEGQADAKTDQIIEGFAGAAGVIEGEVRRLDTPDDGHMLKPGEILVTTTTNIGWTTLFPLASAIVTDVGAPLSHAAIVARELGIPAVVGCGSATMRLQTGDRVRVYGSKGVIEKLTPEP